MNRTAIGILVILVTSIGVGIGVASWLHTKKAAEAEIANTENAVKASLGPSGAFSYKSVSLSVENGGAVFFDVSLFKPGIAISAKSLELDSQKNVTAHAVRVTTDDIVLESSVARISNTEMENGRIVGAGEIRLDRVIAEFSTTFPHLHGTAQYAIFTALGHKEAGFSLVGLTIPVKIDGIVYRLHSDKISGSDLGNSSTKLLLSKFVLDDRLVQAPLIEADKIEGDINRSGNQVTTNLKASNILVHFPYSGAKEALSFMGLPKDNPGSFACHTVVDRKVGSLSIEDCSISVNSIGDFYVAAFMNRKRENADIIHWNLSSLYAQFEDNKDFIVNLSKHASKMQISTDELRQRLWARAMQNRPIRPKLSTTQMPVTGKPVSVFNMPHGDDLQSYIGKLLDNPQPDSSEISADSMPTRTEDEAAPK